MFIAVGSDIQIIVSTADDARSGSSVGNGTSGGHLGFSVAGVSIVCVESDSTVTAEQSVDCDFFVENDVALDFKRFVFTAVTEDVINGRTVRNRSGIFNRTVSGSRTLEAPVAGAGNFSVDISKSANDDIRSNDMISDDLEIIVTAAEDIRTGIEHDGGILDAVNHTCISGRTVGRTGKSDIALIADGQFVRDIGVSVDRHLRVNEAVVEVHIAVRTAEDAHTLTVRNSAALSHIGSGINSGFDLSVDLKSAVSGQESGNFETFGSDRFICVDDQIGVTAAEDRSGESIAVSDTSGIAERTDNIAFGIFILNFTVENQVAAAGHFSAESRNIVNSNIVIDDMSIGNRQIPVDTAEDISRIAVNGSDIFTEVNNTASAGGSEELDCCRGFGSFALALIGSFNTASGSFNSCFSVEDHTAVKNCYTVNSQ